ncbi:MAG: hypothetical protein BAJATHORv1_60094 [Candidatus Thorarchaeota archaeon]|nr:MAG: hypothetical protein BAJATHORv1_60094 [Candidatus Thorarchaeota archaeon]
MECSDPDGSVIEYQLEFDEEDDFIDSTSITTSCTNHTFTELADGTYYVRIRSVDDLTFKSDWSSTVEIFVYTGSLSIFSASNSTILDTATNQTIKWTINSNYPFSYEVFRNDELIDKRTNWNNDVVVEINDYTPGIYEYRIVVIDILGREFSDTVSITIERDNGLAVLTVSIYGGVSAVMLIGVIGAVMVLSRRKIKSTLEKAMEDNDIVSIIDLRMILGKSDQETRKIVEDSPIVILSQDGEFAVSFLWLSEKIGTSLNENGHLDIQKLSKLSGVSSDKIKQIADGSEPDLIFTDDYQCYRRKILVDKVSEYLLSQEYTTMSELEQVFHLPSHILTELLASSRLTILKTEDDTIRTVDKKFQEIIQRAQNLNIIFLSDEAERLEIPLDDLVRALQYKRFDEIQIIVSADLIISSKWISDFRKSLQEDRERTLSSLKSDSNLDEQQVDTIIRRYSRPKESKPVTRKAVPRTQEFPSKMVEDRPRKIPQYTPTQEFSSRKESENIDAARGVITVGVLIGIFLSGIIGLIIAIIGIIIYLNVLCTGPKKSLEKPGGVICPKCWTTSAYHVSQQDMFGKVNCPNCGEHFKPDKLVHY